MNFFSTWGPWLGIAALSGAVNVFVALDELFTACQRLPFFQPHRSIGFWLWVTFQFSIPAALAWLLLDLSQQPPPTLDLWGRSFGFGLAFVVVLNSRTDISALPTVDIKQFYNLLVKYAKDQIAAQHTGKTTTFQVAIKKALNHDPGQLGQGFEYLKTYFDVDIALTNDEKQQYQNEIDLAEAKTTTEETVKAALTLIAKVRRRDLPAALHQFGCPYPLIQQYFPHASPPSTSQP